MKKISEPIAFFGSGPVAAESLRLLAEDFEIEAVITKPRPPHHKGSVPVLELAEQLNITTFAAVNKKELDALFADRPVRSRLAVLIDFGIIVSQDVIDYFELGIINSHFSLLPEWRGADPIAFSILSGQQKTGVSLMLLTAGMDEGPILAAGEYDLPSDITTPQLTADLIQLSHQLLLSVLPEYVAGNATAISQEQSAALLGIGAKPTFSRKLTKEDGLLDFTKPAAVLEREIRAFAEWPKSRTTLGGIDCVVTAAHVEATAASEAPGSLELDSGSKKLAVHCADALLVIDKLKPAGKAEMPVTAFLAGYGAKLEV